MEFKESSKPKKSIFNTFLAKRSTKVEPHLLDDRNGTTSYDEYLHEQQSTSTSHDQHPLQTSVSANSTPIKRLYKIGKLNRLWHCHGSNLSLNSNHSIPSHFLRKTSNSTKKRISTTKDRHSHPIANTQHHDNVFFMVDTTLNDDQIKRAKNQCHLNGTINNNNNNINNKCNHNQNHNQKVHQQKLTLVNQYENGIPKQSGLSKSQEQIIVNDIDENILCDDSSKQRSPTSKSHDGNFSCSRDDLDYPEGHSIAMSACRSRLREKLLPPGYKHKALIQAQQQQQQQQHLSFTNASSNDKKGRPPNEQRNARSFSCDILSNAKRSGRTESLAKNTLMAAQLINLIPTEVARERYILCIYIISFND